MRILRPFFLADELADNKVSQQDGMIFLLSYLILYLVIYRYSVWLGRPEGLSWFIESGLEVVITVIGILYCWKMNGAESGKEFVFRVIYLSVPVGIIVTSSGILVGLLLRPISGEIYEASPLDPLVTYFIFLYLQFFILQFIYWYLIGTNLRRIRERIAETGV